VFLFTAEQYDRDHAALAVLLGLNGLRVSEACATNVEDLGFERGSERRSSWRRSTPVSRDATFRSLLATPTLARRPSTTGDVRTSTVTPPTSSSPSSPAANRQFRDASRSKYA
jgi:integrase